METKLKEIIEVADKRTKGIWVFSKNDNGVCSVIGDGA